MNKMYDGIGLLDCTLQMSDLCKLLNKLSVPWSIDRVNDTIVHLKIWRNGSTFRLRFVSEYGTYKFTGFLEG